MSLSPASIDPLYLNDPLFFFHPQLLDRFGRPCAILNLRYVARTQDGQLDGIKDFIRLGWETSRRWLSDLSRKKGQPQLQIVVIVDLEGAGMSNLVSPSVQSTRLTAARTGGKTLSTDTDPVPSSYALWLGPLLPIIRKSNYCPSSWTCSKVISRVWSEQVSVHVRLSQSVSLSVADHSPPAGAP